jgi:hypothetical protein
VKRILLDDQKARFIARGVRIPVFAWFTWSSGCGTRQLLGASRCRRASSVQAASIAAPLRSIKLTSTEVLEGGVSVLKPLMHSRDTGGRRPPERKNLREKSCLLTSRLRRGDRNLSSGESTRRGVRAEKSAIPAKGDRGLSDSAMERSYSEQTGALHRRSRPMTLRPGPADYVQGRAGPP